MKIDILFGILLTLNRSRKTTVSRLAQKYDVSTRTVHRYLTVLDSNNILIHTKRGKNGGVYLDNCVGLNNLFFTAAEKVALLNLTHQIQSKTLQQTIQTKLLNL